MENTFRTFDAVLSVVGITVYSRTRWESKRWLIFQVLSLFQGFLSFIFTSGFVLLSFSDIIIWIEGACIWTTGVIMFISLGICLVFRRKFRQFLNEMGFRDAMMEMPFMEYVLKSEGHGKIGELKRLVVTTQEKLLKYTTTLLKIYVGSVFLSATLYLCDAIYKMIITEDKSLRLLAFDMWFPWSLEDFRVYIASFIFHAYTGYLCAIAYPGLQCTIVLLVGQTIRQLRILSFILLNLDDLAMEVVRERNEKWQNCCTALLSQCIDHYSKIKSFSNRINVICRPFYLTLILVATMLVCVTSVKIAISPKLAPDTIKYYFHEFCFVLVVLLFCSLGQEVENECEKIEQNVLEKWYIFNRAHKVNVLIFKMALDQGIPIYIFGSIPLSLPTFTWFIKTGMSFFTLVMSVLEEQN